jgi:competence protein ComGC
MKNKLFAYTVFPALLGFGLLGASAVSACGLGGWGWGFGFSNATSSPDIIASRLTALFQYEAQILGISVDDVKNAWADGKTIKQIMQEKNISQDQVNKNIKDYQIQQYKTQLQTLVSKGVITQAQADKRLQYMQNKIQNSNGKSWMKMFRKGFGLF